MRRLIPILCVSALVLGCPGAGSIKFGAVLPLTGDSAVYGESVKKGIELAFEQLQARPDNEHTFELTILDSESDPQVAAQRLAELYDGGALAVVGGVTTAEALAMVSIADENDRVLLSPSASSPELTGISKNFFRVFFSDFDEGTKMGNFAAGKGYSPVVILAKEETWATGVQEIFAEEFTRNDGEVLEILEFPAGTSDFSGLVERGQHSRAGVGLPGGLRPGRRQADRRSPRQRIRRQDPDLPRLRVASGAAGGGSCGLRCAAHRAQLRGHRGG